MAAIVTPQSLTRPPSHPTAGLGTSEAVEIGDQLKTMFDRLTTGPMPRRLLDLADALEEAFQRGDLYEPPKGGGRS